jgi:hypothetical protein
MSMAKKKPRPAPAKKKKAPAKPASKRTHSRKPSRPVVASRSPALAIRQALEASGGVLRLAPNWVPRPLLSPGRRLKLDSRDLYAQGAQRGGICERWIASTTPTVNPGAPSEEGLSYIAVKGERLCTLAEVLELAGAQLLGPGIWERYRRWPVYAKFFDNQGPIPLHMHQSNAQAALVGRQGKPEAHYFPPQLNGSSNDFPYTFFGLEPGTTSADVRRCLERWNEGDNGVLALSRAYKLLPGSGWRIPAGVLHAPGSLVTFAVQWGSDVYAMYQSITDGRPLDWDHLVRDVPAERQHDLDYLVGQLDWEANTDPQFKQNHYLEPVKIEGQVEGSQDRWIIYGKFDDQELFTAKETRIEPGTRVTIRDEGAYGLIAMQGSGWIGKQRLQTPAMSRYGELTDDEVFVSHEAARQGVVFDNTGAEPLVVLRFFGPDTNPLAPRVGPANKNW